MEMMTSPKGLKETCNQAEQCAGQKPMGECTGKKSGGGK